MSAPETHPNRTIFRLTGPDRIHFLQNLVTCDVEKIEGIGYGALLTPQGKFLADFFLIPEGDAMLIDTDSTLAPTLGKMLQMYKLRAKIGLEITDKCAIRAISDPPEDALPDPRDPRLGWRAYRDSPAPGGENIDWDALRVAACVPETGREIGPDTLILEAGFERMGGVDFKKGCYVGQEVTARMKHKTELKKGFVKVALDGAAREGDTITDETGAEVGKLHTTSGTHAIAYLRFGRAKGELRAGSAVVTRVE